MLDEKNKSISFLFMAALSRGFNQDKLKQYVDLAKANSEVLVYTLKQKTNLKPLRRNLLNLCLILVRSQTCQETEPF